MADRVPKVFLILFCLTLALSSAAGASWVRSGVPVCTAPYSQYNPCMISDDARGAIIAWKDYRSGIADIYVQRIDAAGIVLWTLNGIAVCDAGDYQNEQEIVPDGAGGVIIAWRDNRGTSKDIYAQRISADGTAMWTENGVPICTASGDQVGPSMAADGHGGAFIVWKDRRSGTDDVFAQLVNSEGEAMWTADGVPISKISVSYIEDPGEPEILPDGAGNAIVIWSDRRSGRQQVYAQKVDPDGIRLWPADGVLVSSVYAPQEHYKMVSDGNGGAIVTWGADPREHLNNDLFAQKITSDGLVAWTPEGVTVCYNVDDCVLFPSIIEDGNGGAFIAWRDDRNLNADVFAQRVDADGDALWTANGVEICIVPDYIVHGTRIVTDGSGGAIISWQDFRDVLGALYFQRVDGNGTIQWDVNGVRVFEPESWQSGHETLTDGHGQTIVVWSENRDANSENIYCSKMAEDGQLAVATFLVESSWSTGEDEVVVRWTLSEVSDGLTPLVWRAEGSCDDFVRIPSPRIMRDGAAFTFIDDDCGHGSSYRYRIGVSESGDQRILFDTGVIVLPAVPLTLYQNYPNPFNPATAITFYLPEASHAVLDIFDTAGRRVAVLVDEYRDRGRHTIGWEARSKAGAPLSSGVYFYRLRAGKMAITRKMLLLR